MADTWVNYRAVKAAVSMETVLATIAFAFTASTASIFEGAAHCRRTRRKAATAGIGLLPPARASLSTSRRMPGPAILIPALRREAGGLAATSSISCRQWKTVPFVKRP
jgi:hypothetical protein